MQLSKIEKAWFPVPDDPDKSKFEIKNLLSGDLTYIEDQASQEVVEMVQGEDGEHTVKAKIVANKKLRNELTVCAAVTGWENVRDADGNLLEYSEENKLRFCRELPQDTWVGFLKFLNKSRAALVTQIEEQEQAARGN